MAENKLGIENLKKGIGLFLSIGMETDKALEDKKFDWKDAMGYFDELMTIEPVYQKRLEIIAEAQDIIADERTELNKWAEATFDIKSDEVEVKVEAAIDALLSMLKLWAVFKPKTPATPKP